MACAGSSDLPRQAAGTPGPQPASGLSKTCDGLGAAADSAAIEAFSVICNRWVASRRLTQAGLEGRVLELEASLQAAEARAASLEHCLEAAYRISRQQKIRVAAAERCLGASHFLVVLGGTQLLAARAASADTARLLAQEKEWSQQAEGALTGIARAIGNHSFSHAEMSDVIGRNLSQVIGPEKFTRRWTRTV